MPRLTRLTTLPLALLLPLLTTTTAHATTHTKKTPKPTPAATTNPTPTTTPTPNPDTPLANNTDPINIITNIITYLTQHPTLPLLITALITLNWYWKKNVTTKAQQGIGIPTLPEIITTTRRLIYTEDTNPVITNPKLAPHTTWLTWTTYWKTTTTIAVTLILITTTPLNNHTPTPLTITLALTLIPLITAGTKHNRAILAQRRWTTAQMFAVSQTENRLPRGAELIPWKWIIIQKWNNLYTPDEVTIIIPEGTRTDDAKRETFERNFNATTTTAHTWTYNWEPSNNRIIAKPVPNLPDRADYKFPDTNPWSVFPIGIMANGEEATYDVAVQPHSLLGGTSGSGKLVSLSTTLPTATGWTTMGEVQVGETLFDENGNLCTVTWISDINPKPDLYEVEFSDGSIIEADADHLWWTETRQVRATRWNARRKNAKREQVIAPENMERLRSALENAGPDDEITVPEITTLAGLSLTTGWIYDEANRIGWVSENDIYTDFHYAEQTVRQRQSVTVFDAAALWTALAEYEARRSPRRATAAWYARLAECEALAAAAVPGDVVSLVDLREFLGVPHDVAASLVRRVDVPSWTEQRVVELFVPAKTVRRKSAMSVRGFPRRALLSAVIERGELLKWDRRHRRAVGGVKTTAEIRDSLRVGNECAVNHSVPVAKPLVLPEADLLIHPYLLGVWLGDGDSREPMFCGIDHEIARHVERLGYTLRERREATDRKHPDFRIWTAVGVRRLFRELSLLQKTTEEGSQKHIPGVYLRASVEQRRALLAGLLDTDGTVSPAGAVSFANTNERLARDVRELALSLGYRASLTSSVKRSQTGTEALAWTVSWTCGESPFWLSRKTLVHQERNASLTSERNDTRFIVDVRPVPSAPGRCIAVDSPSRLFLCGDSLIPTHNSVTQRTILLHALQSPDWRVALIDPKRVELSPYRKHPHVVAVATELDESVELLRQAEQEMQARYKRMQQEGVNFFKRLSDPPPALLIMIDELFALLSPENVKSEEGKERDELHAQSALLIGSIARLGRAAGVHLVMATQRPDAKVLGGEVKALALDTPLPSPGGWVLMGDVGVGDELFDDVGRVCRVVDVTGVMLGHRVFEVEFCDGEVVVADGGHQWVTHDLVFRRGGQGMPGVPGVVTTEEIAGSVVVGGQWNHGVPVAGALDLLDVVLPVEPFVFGRWLVAGDSDAVADVDVEVLRSLGVLGEKRVPGVYLRAGNAQRLELLRGLLAAAGETGVAGVAGVAGDTANPEVDAPVGFVCGSELLARDVLELVRSLGVRAMLEHDTTTDAGVWRVSWTGSPGEQGVPGAYRFITAVREVASVPVRCIMVDSPSHLYLAGRAMTPTHNSNLDVRIAMGRMDTTPSLMMLDTDAATRLPAVKGRAILRTGGSWREVQSYFLPDELLDQVLQLSIALSTGMVTVDALKELIEAQPGNAGADDAAGGGGVVGRLVARVVPGRVRGWFAGWVAGRRAVVEANEAGVGEFAARAGRTEEGNGDGEGVARRSRWWGRREGASDLDGDGVLSDEEARLIAAGRGEESVDEVVAEFDAEFGTLRPGRGPGSGSSAGLLDRSLDDDSVLDFDEFDLDESFFDDFDAWEAKLAARLESVGTGGGVGVDGVEDPFGESDGELAELEALLGRVTADSEPGEPVADEVDENDNDDVAVVEPGPVPDMVVPVPVPVPDVVPVTTESEPESEPKPVAVEAEPEPVAEVFPVVPGVDDAADASAVAESVAGEAEVVPGTTLGLFDSVRGVFDRDGVGFGLRVLLGRPGKPGRVGGKRRRVEQNEPGSVESVAPVVVPVPPVTPVAPVVPAPPAEPEAFVPAVSVEQAPVEQTPPASGQTATGSAVDIEDMPWLPNVPIPDGPVGPSPFGAAAPAPVQPTPSQTPVPEVAPGEPGVPVGELNGEPAARIDSGDTDTGAGADTAAGVAAGVPVRPVRPGSPTPVPPVPPVIPAGETNMTGTDVATSSSVPPPPPARLRPVRPPIGTPVDPANDDEATQ